MIVRLLTLIATMCFASGAQAATILWTAAANTCVHANSNGGNPVHGSPAVFHLGGNTNQITLNCAVNVFVNASTRWKLWLTYQDSTGTGTAAYVSARLSRIPLFPPPGFAGSIPIATVNSNSSIKTAINFISSPTFTHTFNFNINTYWVQVTLDRTLTTESVTFYSASLQAL